MSDIPQGLWIHVSMGMTVTFEDIGYMYRVKEDHGMMCAESVVDICLHNY